MPSTVLKGECSCPMWADRLQMPGVFKGRAATFDCDVHGKVTLDNRPLPAPRSDTLPSGHWRMPMPDTHKGR